MKNEQMIGRYERLRAELAEAYAQAEWSSCRIDEIADELASLERTLAAVAPLEDRAAISAWISSARRDLGSDPVEHMT